MRHQGGVNTKALQGRERSQQTGAGRSLRLAAAVVVTLISLSAGAMQSDLGSVARNARRAAASRQAGMATDKKSTEPDLRWLQEALKNPDLLAEVGRIAEKLQKGVQYPAARRQSRILSRLPETTTFYAAIPNYGETMHQALEIFQRELKVSPPLQEFVLKNKLDTAEPQIESGVQKFYELSQFLGDEIVIAGRLKGEEPNGVMIAEIRKPGLREFLEKLNEEFITSKSNRLFILDQQQLAAASEKDKAQGLVVLVRQDFVAVGFSVAALREFNSQIDRDGPRFLSTGLGQRLAQSYRGGTNSLGGVDLRQLISSMPKGKPQDRMMLEKSGFADVKYLVAESKISAEGTANQAELTFDGPRRGLASWIGAPAPMGALDFVSPGAAMVADVMLKNPAQIFDEVREISGEQSFASLARAESELNVSLKRDILGKLGGEIAFESKMPPLPAREQNNAAPAPPKPGSFKVILSVVDAEGLQLTLSKLLAATGMQTGRREEDGVTFNTLVFPSQAQPVEISYFFQDGYLVIASDPATAKEAVSLHNRGGSLGKSGKLRDALRGQSTNASVMFYQNAGQMLGAMMSQLPAELRSLVPATGSADTTPNVFTVYADESAFRAASNSNVQAEMGVAMVVAAVAVPNLLRARMAANESAAAATVRTVNTAQVTYTTIYPAKGYAPSLATLGPGPGGGCTGNNATATHACLLDDVLGNAKCTAGQWCEKNVYKFSVRAACGPAGCRSYVVTATPVNASTGGKSFCSTAADLVIRSQAGPPLEAPLTAAQCRAWEAIQ